MLGDLQNSFLAAQALYLLLWVTEKEREGAEAAEKEGKREKKKERNDREKEMKDRDTRLEK